MAKAQAWGHVRGAHWPMACLSTGSLGGAHALFCFSHSETMRGWAMCPFLSQISVGIEVRCRDQWKSSTLKGEFARSVRTLLVQHPRRFQVAWDSRRLTLGYFVTLWSYPWARQASSLFICKYTCRCTCHRQKENIMLIIKTKEQPNKNLIAVYLHRVVVPKVTWHRL